MRVVIALEMSRNLGPEGMGIDGRGEGATGLHEGDEEVLGLGERHDSNGSARDPHDAR